MGQYIGAKVTPTFYENPLDHSNLWVAGITYEELTVVSYNNVWYVSKKPVPAGVLPTDTSYWIPYPYTDVIGDYQNQLDDLRDDLSDTRTIIDLLHNVEEGAIIDSPYTGGGAYPSAGAEFLITANEIKAGSIITQFDFQNSTASGDYSLTYSLWRKAGNGYERYKTDTITGSTRNGHIIFDTSASIHYNSFISIVGNAAFYSKISENNLLSVTGDFITEAQFVNGRIGYSFILKVLGVMPVTGSRGIDVHVGEGQDYEEIQEALEDTGNEDITIILHPKRTPYKRFSMLRSLNESYPWSGISHVRNISIIGMDRSKCIIKDTSGNYNSPPAEIACNGIIKNITFISTHDDAEWSSGDIPGYAVHIDNRPLDTAGMTLTFEDCIFVSEQCCAVGVGVYRNQTITFDSCEFYNNTPDNFLPYTGYNQYYNNLGALIAHTSMGEAKGNDHFRMINNILITKNNNYTAALRETETEPTCILELIGNTLWNEKNQNSTIRWEGSGTFIQAGYNRLNNNGDINA